MRVFIFELHWCVQSLTFMMNMWLLKPSDWCLPVPRKKRKPNAASMLYHEKYMGKNWINNHRANKVIHCSLPLILRVAYVVIFMIAWWYYMVSLATVYKWMQHISSIITGQQWGMISFLWLCLHAQCLIPSLSLVLWGYRRSFSFYFKPPSHLKWLQEQTRCMNNILEII